MNHPFFRFAFLLTMLLTLQGLSFAQTASCTNWTTFTVNGSPTVPNGINSWGTVVGQVDQQSGVFGFIRSSNSLSNTYKVPSSVATWFTRRNYSGVTVGYFLDSNARHHGLVVSKSGTEATVDYPKALGTWLTGINYWGSIVGYYKGSDFLFHGFELKNGVFTLIKYPNSAQNVPTGISDQGVIVGYYQNPAGGGIGFPHGFVYAKGAYRTLDDPNGAGTLGGGTYLYDVNSSGLIVGAYVYRNTTHSFLYTNGSFKSINAPSGGMTSAAGINNQGYVVGSENTGSSQTGFEAHCQ